MHAPGLMPLPLKQHNVIVFRHNTRRFRNEKALLAQLRTQSPDQIWRVYHGWETVAETLRLFGAAHASIGFHGAGLINMVFSQTPCPHVHELTTLRRVGSSDRWRSYIGTIVKTWNPRVHKTIQTIPLERILMANGFPSHANISDSAIKNLIWIPVTMQEVHIIGINIQNSTRTGMPKMP
jgi:hypothetical protein